MKRPIGFGAFPRALGAGLQVELLVLWFLFTLIPALIVSRPLHAMLSKLMDHSVHAGDWARSFHGMAMTDVSVQIGRLGMSTLTTAFIVSTVLMLLLSPFLTGMSVTAVRGAQKPGFGELMHGGLREYWRLFRFMLWALALYAAVMFLSVMASGAVSGYAKTAILESKVDFRASIVHVISIALFVLAQAMIEAGRGRIVAQPNQRSATRAFFEGIGMLFQRPLVTLGMFLGVTVIGMLIVLLLGMWRVQLVSVGPFGIFLALLVSALVVVAMAWMRTARLAAMAAIADAS